MNEEIHINLAVEDELSENILRVILHQSGKNFDVVACHGRRGSGFLKKHISGFNNASKGSPFLLLTDLNSCECAPQLKREWQPKKLHNNFIFRIAVREVESWIMAHNDSFASFLGVSTKYIPKNPDELDDPKRILLQIAAKSKKRELREAILPKFRGTARVGPDYNGALSRFLYTNWNVREALKNSPSLKRAFEAILSFNPVYRRKT